MCVNPAEWEDEIKCFHCSNKIRLSSRNLYRVNLGDSRPCVCAYYVDCPHCKMRVGTGNVPLLVRLAANDKFNKT